MKQQSIALSFAFMLLGSAPANAAESPPDTPPDDRKRFLVATSLVTPMFGAYYIEGNLRLSDRFSALVNGSRLTLDREDWSTQTNSVGAGLDYYFQGEALRKWYVEAQGELLISSWKHDPSGASASVAFGATGTALVCYRFVSDFGPVLDLGAGVVALRFPGARADTPNGPVTLNAFTHVYPALKVSVGWAF